MTFFGFRLPEEIAKKGHHGVMVIHNSHLMQRLTKDHDALQVALFSSCSRPFSG
jgi:hypothetical protein